MAEPLKQNVTDTPEFKAAVREEAAKAVAEALALARSEAGTPTNIADMSWVQALALEMATLTDQGTGRRTRVPPEVVKQRAQARELMFQLIIEARGKGDIPSYRLTNKVLLDNQLVDPVWIDAHHTAQPTEIDWPGVPNEAMLPINVVARGIFQAFQDSIGTIAKGDADVLGKLNQPLGVTPGGLVVKGAAASAGGGKRALQARVDGLNSTANDEGLKLRHRDQPGRYTEVNILGTIAAPARQSI